MTRESDSLESYHAELTYRKTSPEKPGLAPAPAAMQQTPVTTTAHQQLRGRIGLTGVGQTRPLHYFVLVLAMVAVVWGGIATVRNIQGRRIVADALRQETDQAHTLDDALYKLNQELTAANAAVPSKAALWEQYWQQARAQGWAYADRSTDTVTLLSENAWAKAHSAACEPAVSRIADLELKTKDFIHAHPKSRFAPGLLDYLAIAQSWCWPQAARETDILLRAYPKTSGR